MPVVTVRVANYKCHKDKDNRLFYVYKTNIICKHQNDEHTPMSPL